MAENGDNLVKNGDDPVKSGGSALGDRIHQVCEGLGGWEAAARLIRQIAGEKPDGGGVKRSGRSLQRYAAGDDPPASIIAALSAISGRSAQWILTGQDLPGPANLSEPPAHEPQDRPAGLIDRVLHGKRGEGKPVPGWSQEFADRLDAVVAQVGGPASAAQLAGVSKPTLFAWRDGEAPPSLPELARLARHARMTLEWLATGQGKQHVPANESAPPESDLDRELMRQSIIGCAEYARKHGHHLTPQEQAAIYITMYDHLRETGSPADVESIGLTLRTLEKLR